MDRSVPIRNETKAPLALRRAPLSSASIDGQVAERLARLVATRLPATFGDPDLVDRLSALGVTWLEAKPGRVRPDAAGRLRLPPPVSRELERLGRTVLWMQHKHYHHGQQAAKEAVKTLRALRSGRLDLDALLAHAARFRILRQGHVRHNARDKAHAAARTVPLLGGAYQATRVVTQRGLHQLGQDAGNCLANPDHGRRYAARLRQGEAEFWRIDWVNQGEIAGRRMVWAVGFDAAVSKVKDLSDKRDPDSMIADRGALLEFLVGMGRCSGSGRPEDYAISCSLLAAARAGMLHRFCAEMAGKTWHFEAGPGVLVGLPKGGDARFDTEDVSALVLHGVETGEDIILSIMQGWWAAKDAEQYVDFGTEVSITAVHYRRGRAIRLALRAACAGSRRLQQACAEAFAAEGADFRADWFGTVLPAPL